MRGRGLLCKKSPPSRSLPKKITVGRFWGRGRFSERSASPPDPLSRRAAGNRLGCSFGVERPCECGWSPIGWVVVTAADRAAATFAACGGNPSARISRAPPLSGEAVLGVSPQRPPFSPRAHPPYADPRKADGTRHQLFLYPVAPSPTLHVRGGSVSRRGLNQPSENRAPLSGGTTYAEAANPNASRSSGERGLGGEALLSEKRPLPPEFPRSLISL